MTRPTYSQGHPSMRVAQNIVNQILDEAGTDVDTRQRINDDCDQFTAWMIEGHAGRASALLSKYIRYVSACEGIDFLSGENDEEESGLTDDEWATLQGLRTK